MSKTICISYLVDPSNLFCCLALGRKLRGLVTGFFPFEASHQAAIFYNATGDPARRI